MSELERAEMQRDIAYQMYKDAVENFLPEQKKAELWNIFTAFRQVAWEYDMLATEAWQREARDVGFGYMGRPL